MIVSPFRWVRPYRASKRRQEAVIVLLGLGIIVFLTATSVESIVRSRERCLARSEAELQSVATVLAAQTLRSFEVVRLAQTNIEEMLNASGCLSVSSLEACSGTESVYRVLRQKKDALNGVDAFTVVSSGGWLLNMSRSWPPPRITARERDFVTAFQHDKTLVDFVSRPARSKLTGAWTVFLAHRLTAGDGSLLGIVLAAMRLKDFEDFYKSLNLPDDASVNLFRRDGTMLARYPHIDPAIGVSASERGTLFSAVLAKTKSEVLLGKSFVDGLPKILAAQPLDHFPAVVTVSRSVDAVLAPWWRDALQLALTTLMTVTVTIISAIVGLNQLRHAHKLARVDTLTGVPNRVFFHEAMATTFYDKGTDFAFFLADLDGFKEVNDRFGHQAGDALLRAAAGRIRTLLDPSDTLARMGGDEFAIIRRTCGAQPDAGRLASAIIVAFQTPFSILGLSIVTGVSLGIAFPKVVGDEDSLYREADTALYRAKVAGRGTFRIFDTQMAEQFLARRKLRHDLRDAVELGEIHLAYQPLLDLTSGRIRAFEALARWRHPELGTLQPSDFIPLAEDNGQIGAMGRWILREACLTAATWPRSIRVAVNLSTVQFRVSDIFADVTDALAASGLDPERLELEITESVQIAEDGTAGETLLRVKALGVKISLDDFGTGYSSLSYLRSFPFDKIKIDRSFVASLSTSSCSAAIVEASLALAQKLGMETTAEGVETAEQLARLHDIGCTEAQGYFISCPVAREDVTSLIADRETVGHSLA